MEKYEKIEFDMNTIDSAISYSEEWVVRSCRHVSVTLEDLSANFMMRALSDIYVTNR
jgi:hypothetical protein